MISMSAKNNGDVIGIIYPILHDHCQRLLEGGKDVFVKFVSRRPSMLRPGSRLFFYESGGKKEIVGEAKIVEVTDGTLEEVLRKFSDRLFLTREELERYAGERRTKKMLVCVISDVKRYSTPLKLGRSLTMAGQYMTKRMRKSLRDTGQVGCNPRS